MTEQPNTTKLVERIYIPKKLARAVHYYAKDEQAKITDPAARSLITEEGLMVAAIEEKVRAVGHYPPRDGVKNG